MAGKQVWMNLVCITLLIDLITFYLEWCEGREKEEVYG